MEEGKHDAYAWVGPDDIELMMRGRTDGDRRLRDIVAKAVRTRLTDRLRLEPVGPEHADDLVRPHQDGPVAGQRGDRDRWSPDMVLRTAARCAAGWETDGCHRWVAYDRRDGELVGWGGLSCVEVGGERRFGLDWTVRPGHWGCGYATELARAGLTLAFDDMGAETVVSVTEPHDGCSAAVLRRLGMRPVREVVHGDAPVVLHVARRPVT